MGIRYLKKYASLEDVVSVEDAEALLRWLRSRTRPAVHLGRCIHLHAAVLQVLLAVKPQLIAAPSDPHLAAAITGSTR